MSDPRAALDAFLESVEIAKRVKNDPNRTDSAVRSAASWLVTTKADLFEAVEEADASIVRTAEGPGGDEPDPEQATEADLLDDLLRARLGECSECHQIGACAYDAEGRPMIHVSEDRDG